MSLVNYFPWSVLWSFVAGSIFSDIEQDWLFLLEELRPQRLLERLPLGPSDGGFGGYGGWAVWFPAWVFREVEMGSLLWSHRQTKRGGLRFESRAHLSASWSHRNTWRTLVNRLQLLIKCRVRVQGCFGLSGFLSLYKVLLRSDLFLTHQLFSGGMGAFLCLCRLV